MSIDRSRHTFAPDDPAPKPDDGFFDDYDDSIDERAEWEGSYLEDNPDATSEAIEREWAIYEATL